MRKPAVRAPVLFLGPLALQDVQDWACNANRPSFGVFLLTINLCDQCGHVFTFFDQNFFKNSLYKGKLDFYLIQPFIQAIKNITFF